MTRFKDYKPNGISDEAWQIVLEAWENGLSDREVAFRVSNLCEPLTISDIAAWYKDNELLIDLKASLQSEMLTKARLVVNDAISDGDVKTAKWYLERKAVDEFSTKQAVALEGAAISLSLEDKGKALDEMMARFEQDGE